MQFLEKLWKMLENKKFFREMFLAIEIKKKANRNTNE